MAKLSARGQKEIARFAREKVLNFDRVIDWERETVAIMDSGKVLVKRDVRFVGLAEGPRRHSYGWKTLAERLKDPTNRAAYIERLRLAGYVKVAK